jgi:DNA-binding LacI/PurR family transcriptional regulator
MKATAVERVLRERILANRLPSGGRLPNRTDLLGEMQCSPLTLQRAIDGLRDDGFVHTRGRAGTFVVPHPPHLHRIGLVLPHRAVDGAPASLFWTALLRVAKDLERETTHQLPVMFDSRTHAHAADYAELERHVTERLVAGLIFLALPHASLAGTPVLVQPGIARAMVALPNPEADDEIPCVFVDFKSFIDRALARLKARGRRRVALLATGFLDDIDQHFLQEAARLGLETRPHWVQVVHQDTRPWANNLVQLLFSGPARERPDALIVLDDHLLEAATAGLRAVGETVWRGVDVMAHCNYPALPRAAVPVIWLGFPARQVLKQCMEQIERQRAGLKPQRLVMVPAQFAEETEGAARKGRISVTATATGGRI